MLVIEGARKSYGTREVLRDVSLEVAPGQVLGLIGANGAGKTTLISIATGLITADAGRVLVGDGERADIDVARQAKRASAHIGLAPQELGVYPMLSVEQNLRVFAELAGMRPGRIRQRIAEVVESLDLSAQLKQRADTLSGGQARRLHTGMALLHRPSVLFLDEPTVGADVGARRAILEVVKELATQGSSVVYTTHYLTELADLAATVAILHEGSIALTGSVDQIVADQASPTIAIATSGESPRLDGWVASALKEGVTRWEAPPSVLGPQGDHGRFLADALAGLPRGTKLEGVEVSPASLETAFLAVTGHRLAGTVDADATASPVEQDQTKEANHVAHA